MTLRSGRLIPKLALAIATVFGSVIAHAGPIGTFSIVGTGNVRVGASFIDWGTPGPVFNGPPYTNCVPGPNPGACVINGSTTGSILFTSGTGGFAGVAGGAGTIKDLEDDFAPTNTSFSLPNFLTSTNVPTLNFTLKFIPLGTGSAAGCTNNPGDVCTPAGSPFTITNLAGGTSTIGLVVRGEVSQPGDPEPSLFEGLFSTQLNITAAQALQQIATTGWVQSSHSAEFTATVIPEPGTISLFGSGLLLLGLHQFRRRRQS